MANVQLVVWRAAASGGHQLLEPSAEGNREVRGIVSDIYERVSFYIRMMYFLSYIYDIVIYIDLHILHQ